MKAIHIDNLERIMARGHQILIPIVLPKDPLENADSGRHGCSQ